MPEAERAGGTHQAKLTRNLILAGRNGRKAGCVCGKTWFIRKSAGLSWPRRWAHSSHPYSPCRRRAGPPPQ